MTHPIDELLTHLGEHREMAEHRMTVRAEVRHLTGRKTPNRETGIEARQYIVEATVPCRVPPMRATAQEADAGGRIVATADREIHVPVSAPPIIEGRFLVITEVGPTDDPTLLGAFFRVTGSGASAQATARRLRVEQVTPFDMEVVP